MGTVTKAEVPEWSHWVIRLEVDLGEEIGTKKCFSGIMKFFKPEDLEGKQFPFVVNLEPRKNRSRQRTFRSYDDYGSSKEDEETPTVLFQLQGLVPNGTKVR